MKHVHAGFGALIVAVGLAACGGGGGGGGGTPPVRTGPTPLAATYSGSETIANVYNGYPPPTTTDPNVTPYPNNTVTYNLSDSLAQQSGSSTITSSETVTEPNEVLTESLTTIVTPSPNGSTTNVTVTKQVYSDSDGMTQTITYPTPLIVDQEPETNGATWSNGAAKVTAETYPDTESINRTTNADGSYVETEVQTEDNIDETATVNSDGSGSWVAATGSLGFLDGCFTQYTFTAPTGGNVTFNATANPSGFCSNQSLTYPAFFSASPTLASYTVKIATPATFPAACNVPSQYGTNGNDVHTAVVDLDPLFGFTEKTITDAYTSPTYGLVCAQSTDTLDTYYDWNLDTAYFIFIGTSPLVVTTTTTTLSLQSGGGIGISSERERSAQSATQGGSVVSSLNAAALAQTLLRGERVRLRALAERRALETITRRPKGGRA